MKNQAPQAKIFRIFVNMDKSKLFFLLPGEIFYETFYALLAGMLNNGSEFVVGFRLRSKNDNSCGFIFIRK